LLDKLWEDIANSELAFQIGATWWFPLLESIHVLCIVVLMAAIISADLRILGVTGRDYKIANFVPELTRWAWVMVIPAVLTGMALFITRPAAYAANPAFQIKMGLLVFSAINVFLLYRKWQPDKPASTAVQFSAALSLCAWVGIIFAGRWVGHIN
jgi:hypothetical protein